MKRWIFLILIFTFQGVYLAGSPTLADDQRPPRPQEPRRPYPYHDEEVFIENEQAGIRLAGTLTLPRSSGPFPAALLITGSGPHDRDETHITHKPFLVLADYFTRRGIAVLRVDDRGVGKSKGNHGTATSEDFAEDALAGVRYLKKRKEINPEWIGLIGHSEGGVIAPLAASQSSDVKFVIMMAGPGQPMRDLMVLQNSMFLRNAGVSEATIAASRDLHLRAFTLLKDAKVGEVTEDQLKKMVEGVKAAVPEAEKQHIRLLTDYGRFGRGLLSPWFRFILSYDPKDVLAKVRCPLLAINGEHDLFVAPNENLQAIESALKEAGNTNYTIRFLPGLNHMFQTAASEDYANIEETMAPIAMKTMADWILSRTTQSQ